MHNYLLYLTSVIFKYVLLLGDGHDTSQKIPRKKELIE